jgi:hypothetical protein
MDAAESDLVARETAAEACVQDLSGVIGGVAKRTPSTAWGGGESDAGNSAHASHTSDSITFAECEQGPNQWVVRTPLSTCC